MDAYRASAYLFGFMADNVGLDAALSEPNLQLKQGNHRTNQEGFGSPFFIR
jgi:hypothetical protein